MGPLGQSPFCDYPESVLALSLFLSSGDYSRLGSTCSLFRKIISENQAYWHPLCLLKNYSPLSGERSYFTFCRGEQLAYNGNRLFGNPKKKYTCSYLKEPKSGYGCRAVNPLNGNLIYIYKERSRTSSHPKYQFQEVATSGEILRSSYLPDICLFTDHVMTKQMRVTFDKILLLSERFFYIFELPSFQMLKKKEIPKYFEDCIDFTVCGESYLFLNHEERHTQLYRLEASTDAFIPLLSFFPHLEFCKHREGRDVMCYNIFNITELYFIDLTTIQCTKISLPHPTFKEHSDLTIGSVTWINHRFLAFVWQYHQEMLIWNREEEDGDSFTITIPRSACPTFYLGEPFEERTLLGIHHQELILYLDYATYSIQVMDEHVQRFINNQSTLTSSHI